MQARRHAHAKSLDAYLFTFLMRVDAMADIVVAEAKTVSPNHFQYSLEFLSSPRRPLFSPPQVFLLVVAGWRGKHKQEAGQRVDSYEVELCCRFIEKSVTIVVVSIPLFLIYLLGT
jgi:hypothetical protein